MGADNDRRVRVALVTDPDEELTDGVVSLAMIFFAPLFFMLGLGILHRRWSAVIPPLGYWECFVLTMAFAMLVVGSKRVR